MPKGTAPVTVEVASDAPRPWISAQVITRGPEIPLARKSHELNNSK
ncbi:MAG: hypothetical protein WCP55_02825 [Lentisphaerota bacterium]